MDESPLFTLDALALTQTQREVVSAFEGIAHRLSPSFVDSRCAVRVSQRHYLRLTVRHRLIPDLSVAVVIAANGEISLTCDMLHPTFFLRFNVPWERNECLGDVDYAYTVLQALMEGRIESEVWWAKDGEGVAKSRDYLLEDGGRTRLYSQYHAGALLDLLTRLNCERRRISFIDEEGVMVCR